MANSDVEHKPPSILNGHSHHGHYACDKLSPSHQHPYLLAARRHLPFALQHRELLFLFVLPILYFRIFPFLLTHNSTPLSIYLSLALVYVPSKVILAAWRTYRDKNDNNANPASRRKRRSSFLLPGGGNEQRTNVEKGRKTINIFLWILGAVWTSWTYTRGISSPFPSSKAIVASTPILQRNASYFIAASFYNNEDILPSWTAETIKLVEVLGADNVYISLTENDSEDNTASKLLHFGRELTKIGAEHSLNITSDLRGYPSENPWKSVEHRMGYMANLRNGALSPLETLNRTFDNIIMLNDVVFHHTDALKLISALNPPKRKGGKKMMACGLDMDGSTLYDAWVLRDSMGKPVSGFYPFFTSPSDQSIVRSGGVLDVGTCWNGIVALDGDMFLPPSLRKTTSTWPKDEALRFPQPPGCIISECALLPLTITNTTGGYPVVVDSSVIVAYSVKWWRYYAVWMRMPVVRLWMSLFEEGYWRVWWWVGMGSGLKWNGLENGKEMGECVVSGWGKDGSGVLKGGIGLRNRTRVDEL